jgi:DinB superfamily
MQDRNQLLEDYLGGIEAVKKVLADCPEGIRHIRPEPGSWGIFDIIFHLADSEAVGYMRLRKAIAENGSTISTYDQDIWADELPYEKMDLNVAFDLFARLRTMSYHLLKSTPEMIWTTHTVVHPEHGSITLDDLLKIYTRHPFVHARQIERVRKKLAS